MFLLEWYRQYLSIKYEAHERRLLIKVDETVCKSCETLKQQLDQVNFEKAQLLTKILKESTPVVEPIVGPKITLPKAIPWAVKRQLMEKEDREKARLMREAPKPVSTEELERDLDIAAEAREGQK